MHGEKDRSFVWEILGKINQIEYFLDILKKLNNRKIDLIKEKGEMESEHALVMDAVIWNESIELEQMQDHEKYWEEIERVTKSFQKEIEYLRENEYLLKQILEEEIKESYFIGKDYIDIEFRILIDKLIAKRGEYKLFLKKSVFNTINPITYFIRLINILSGILMEFLKNIFSIANIKYEEKENAISFTIKTFFGLLLTYIFTILLGKFGILTYLSAILE